jgi:hypothetical protein
MEAIGRTTWAYPGGWMPLGQTGPEPAFTSSDTLCLLNAGDALASVEIVIHYADRDPVGPYRLTIAARRVRRVRCNDLIFPEAVSLETPYAAIVRANVPIVVQVTRQDTRQPANASLGTMAFAGEAGT